MKKFHLTASLMLFASCLGLSAQTETMYERGATYLENTMPPSPDPASVVKYADVPFTHSTGMAEYDVPFYTLQGRELSVPIGLHYASGGIKLDEIAGVAGLGWTLQAGGCITRTVMDLPDEFESYMLHHEMPEGLLLTALENRVDTTFTLNYLRNLLYHKIDSSLDRYSYNVCGLSGTFVIQDDGTVFQLSGDGVLIDYTREADGSIGTFTITGPDGTVYTCSEKETGTHDGQGTTLPGPLTGEADRWSATTAWHMTSMRSRSGLEMAEFTYSEPEEWKRVVRSRCQSMSVTWPSDPYQSNLSPQIESSSKYIHTTYSTKVLSGIVFDGTAVSFSYLKGPSYCRRTGDSSYQQNFPFILDEITVQVQGNPNEVARLDVSCISAPYDGRILLNGLHLYKEDVLDDKWSFTYRSVGCEVSRGSQDWYGYYNGENEFSDNGTGRVFPFEFRPSFNSPELTNGHPNPEYADYMSLISVDNDGAVTRFSYEGSVITASGKDYSVGVRVKSIILPGQLTPVRARYFKYESPVCSTPYVPALDMYCTASLSLRLVEWVSLNDWNYTLYETPVTIGPSIYDARVYYGRVTEEVGDMLRLDIGMDEPSLPVSRTVYEYFTDDVCPSRKSTISRFPEERYPYYAGYNAPDFISPLNGMRGCYYESGPSGTPFLIRKEDYSYEDGACRLVSSTDYEYDKPSCQSVLVDYHATQVLYYWEAPGKVYHEDIYHFPVYASSYSGRQPVRETRVGYHASGNDTTVVTTSYVPRRSLSTPVRVSSVTMTAGNVERQMSYGYADQEALSGDCTSVLASQHCLSTPVKRRVRYTEKSISRPVIGGNSDVSLTDLPAFPDTIIQVVTPLAPAFKEEITQYGWFDILGGQALLPSAHIEKTLGVESWREDVLTRDSRGVITSVKEKGGPQTVILWGYSRRLPVAVIENASISEVYEALGGQEVLIEASSGLDVPSDSYLQQLADLRTELPNAHVTTYTHIPGKGVESVTDPAGMRTTFEYDHAGRLTCIRDNDGNKVEEYDYSLMADENKRRHMRSRTFRSADGQQFSEDVRWWDVYGRTLQDISIDASGNGDDLVTAYGSDFMMHDDAKTWLPYPVQGSAGAFQEDAESSAAGYHGNDLAYSFKNYELSSRDRVVSTALPGYAGEHETAFETDIQAKGSFLVLVPHYEWKEDHVEKIGWYAPDDLVVEKTTDADGRVTSVCKDHFGKTIRTSVGNNGSTHYVYDLYDRLRAVIGSGIELTDTLNMWRYDYDSLGRMSSKGIPGSVREYYTYDDEDRIIAILRDGVIKEMEYDAFGRVLKVWQTLPGGQRALLEQHTYDEYPLGVTGADPKGLKTASCIAEIGPDGNVAGYTDIHISYDESHRPVLIRTLYGAGNTLSEQTEYGFAGEVLSSTCVYTAGTRSDMLTKTFAYDERGRLSAETSVLSLPTGASVPVSIDYEYDDLGRPSQRRMHAPGGIQVVSLTDYTLQGWVASQEVSAGDATLFAENLRYDHGQAFGVSPQYTGLVATREDIWLRPGTAPLTDLVSYVYDPAGRVAADIRKDGVTEYSYDSRGNILSAVSGDESAVYDYAGDILTSVTMPSGQSCTFSHDVLARMTYDGQTGQTITYNSLDLVGNISSNGTTVANYFYLSDGTKTRSLAANGAGLLYRGPFVYRRGSDGSLTFESASFSGGRLTSSGALLYVTDYLGSVRAVVNGSNGAIYKASDYSTFGSESEAGAMQTAPIPSGLTLRDGYTGKEAQTPDFTTGYTDFGARQYSPTLRRWMTPDPLSEKYYGVSPYAFCNNNPVNFVDPDGRKILGASKNDAKKVVSDMHEIFSNDIFNGFRQLIRLDSKRPRLVAEISEYDLKQVLSNPELNTDQRAMIAVVSNTINSSDKHIVEYAGQGNISSYAQSFFEPLMCTSEEMNQLVSSLIETNGGIPASFLSAVGGNQGVTTATRKGSYSVVFDVEHDNGRSVTMGHEVFGHGRSLALRRGAEYQHVDAVQMENLILRVMGINYINNGSNHGPGTIIANPSNIPSYR